MTLLFSLLLAFLIGILAAVVPYYLRQWSRCPKCRRPLHLEIGLPPHCDVCDWGREHE